MKIGEVELRKIPASEKTLCENGCPSNAVGYFNGTPYCAECLGEEQRRKWDRDGNFFVDNTGERVHYRVVQHVS